MIKNSNSKTEIYQPKNEPNDEIDIRYITNPVLRNKALIGLISLITSIVGILYSLSLKEVWEGQFQIVLTKDTNQTQFDPKLANFAGLIKTDNDLETEVEILKSASVLMPVFEFAKAQNDKFKSNHLTFSKWKNNHLKINLIANTSILNISYKNTNKKTIIPTLNQMSISYQQYSGKTKRRSQELTNNFFKEQISLFKEKSNNSLKAAQEYAIDQNLVFYDLDKGSQKPSGLLIPNIGLENARVIAANKIRKINLQLQKIKDLNNSEDLQYIGSTIPALVDEGLPKALSDIESSLLEARSQYTDKDIKIINLIKKRKLAIDLLRNRTIKYLEVQKLEAEATMEASMRPKDVLLEYKELARNSARDEQTLIQLEDQFNLFKLDSATQEDPWELITKPTLLENRVSPKRKNIAFISLITGFFVGIAVSIFKEKNSGIIYDGFEIEKLIPIKLISQINLNNIDLENKNFLFVKDLLQKEANNVVNFVPVGNIKLEELDEFKESLLKEKFKKDIKFSSSQDEIKEYSNYLILKLGYINYSDVSMIKKRIDFLGNNFKGLIVLS